LGLAIAKNLVEIQGGTIEVDYEDSIISFIVRFPIA
jgi:nitrogen-specific signal transduction histidine kinase